MVKEQEEDSKEAAPASEETKGEPAQATESIMIDTTDGAKVKLLEKSVEALIEPSASNEAKSDI